MNLYILVKVAVVRLKDLFLISLRGRRPGLSRCEPGRTISFNQKKHKDFDFTTILLTSDLLWRMTVLELTELIFGLTLLWRLTPD